MTAISRREVCVAGASALALTALPSGVMAANPDVSFVHPQLRPFALQMVKMAAVQPPLSRATLAGRRAAMQAFARPAAASPAFEKHFVKSRHQGYAVPLYAINAVGGASRPAIIHMHGGGFVAGEPVGLISDMQRMAAELDCLIVTVDYRLAPETTYVGSMEDNYAALKWVYDNAEKLGVDRNHIGVMGGSAGGGHAALLALMARDRGEFPLAYQALIYPMLDDRTGSGIAPPAPVGTLLWTADQNRFGWESFLGQTPGTKNVPSIAVPARYADLKGLPPTFIGVGSIDLFVDEDIDYAQRLIAANVSTQLVVVPGAFHGFDGVASETQVAKSFNATLMDALRQGLGGA